MIQTTRYYEEFLRYSKMAAKQQAESNLGSKPHAKSSVRDDLMKHVKLYDVVERKYAGFTQLLLDIVYANTRQHPYYGNLHEIRAPITKNFSGWWKSITLPTQLYVFLVHRITGSAINYAKSPSGYHNTVLPEFYRGTTIKQLSKIMNEFPTPKYTSVGYQFPAFPKPIKGYERGGDYFMTEMMPDLAQKLAKFLTKGPRKDLREVGEFMFQWNIDRGLRRYAFQYAAFISDLADFFPAFVNRESHFYYGSNAAECISYMATSDKLRGLNLLDAVMERAMADTGHVPYNLEDQMCDCIRWIENYIRPGADYDHLCRDSIWSSSKIVDHPFGRQKAMLDLKLVRSFNDINVHPSDDYILKKKNMTVEQYNEKLKKAKII